MNKIHSILKKNCPKLENIELLPLALIGFGVASYTLIKAMKGMYLQISISIYRRVI